MLGGGSVLATPRGCWGSAGGRFVLVYMQHKTTPWTRETITHSPFNLCTMRQLVVYNLGLHVNKLDINKIMGTQLSHFKDNLSSANYTQHSRAFYYSICASGFIYIKKNTPTLKLSLWDSVQWCALIYWHRDPCAIRIRLSLSLMIFPWHLMLFSGISSFSNWMLVCFWRVREKKKSIF